MLKLSTKGRYGSRLMLDLALNYGSGPILLKEIAERQGISIGYLEQIVPGLKAAELITSTRGYKGGYVLSRDPSDITLKEIINALEGPVELTECVNSPGVCDRTRSCVTRDCWTEIGNSIDSILESKTLLDLVHQHRDKEKSQPLMYSI